MSSRTLSLLLSAVLLSLPAAAPGQTVRGRVVDDATGTPLPATVVVLLDSLGLERARVETDRLGGFAVHAPAAGRWTLQTDRAGYGPLLSNVMSVPAGRALEVELRLAALPVPLEPVAVRVERRRVRLDRAGFYHRRDMGIGRFLTAEDIEGRPAIQVSDVLRMEPSVHVYPILSAGEPNAAVIAFRGQVRGFSGRLCLPTLVLDGVIVRRGGSGGIRLDELIHPAEIEAIELYPSSAGAPPRYAATDGRCGVILVWRKRGEEGSAGR